MSSNRKWIGGRKGSSNGFEDDWRPTNRWEFTTDLLPPKRPRDPSLQATLNIYGKWAKSDGLLDGYGKCRPHWWAMQLHRYPHTASYHFNEEELKALQGKCKTLKEAFALAEQVLTDQLIHDFLARANRPNELTAFIYKAKAEIPEKEFPFQTDAWEPYLTDLGSDNYGWLPPGKYFAISTPYNRIRGSFIDCGFWGHSISGREEYNRFALELIKLSEPQTPSDKSWPPIPCNA